MATGKTKAREAERGRFAKQRAEHLEDQLARLMRTAFASGQIAYVGGLEAPLRHGIRASLCLGGWKWRDADRAAMATVEGALKRVRTVRPSWYEGQPEHTIQAGTLVERSRCVECHKPLPEGHFKFCSSGCASTHHSRFARLQEANEDQVVWTATHSI